MTDFNIFSILLAAVASTLVGFLWYATFMAKDGQVKDEEIGSAGIGKKPKKVFAFSLLANILSAFALAILLQAFRAETFLAGLQVAMVVWFLLTGLSGIKKIIIDKKSWDNFLLGTGHDFVSILVAVSILVYFA